ncbi:hypothetical protein GQ61_04450 [Candidatus Nucleicultrix amoebiphila FS5]|jgi:hypothetical protein|uniref:Uncharacterized protein n=1 Tax=Candidatus Nucleicultrix amoebiphila FS5 TaxID=1414854 RepID=A0A1W6N4H3_9PROT|nr:hypothetical protein GQ61_04450 [Candidatus Nucleicultrix amoebiphila FS5]
MGQSESANNPHPMVIEIILRAFLAKKQLANFLYMSLGHIRLKTSENRKESRNIMRRSEIIKTTM